VAREAVAAAAGPAMADGGGAEAVVAAGAAPECAGERARTLLGATSHRLGPDPSSKTNRPLEGEQTCRKKH
jgi:hypothetical protein